MVKNSLVKKFKDEDLQLIIDNNAYHSPEESETDCENGRSNIIVKDLKWRSDTVSISSCFYYFNFTISNYF